MTDCDCRLSNGSERRFDECLLLLCVALKEKIATLQPQPAASSSEVPTKEKFKMSYFTFVQQPLYLEWLLIVI